MAQCLGYPGNAVRLGPVDHRQLPRLPYTLADSIAISTVTPFFRGAGSLRAAISRLAEASRTIQQASFRRVGLGQPRRRPH
jgi:hypothetical protein